jgi:hypothetical protein
MWEIVSILSHPEASARQQKPPRRAFCEHGGAHHFQTLTLEGVDLKVEITTSGAR